MTMHAPDCSRIAADRLPALLRSMPKAELHMHIEGSLEPELIFALAQRNAVQIPYASVEELRRAYAFTNLQSFLDIYYAGASVLLHEQDFYDMARAYLGRAARDNVLHAEIFFDPQTHTARGVAMETVINGLHRACEDARTDLGISATLILCFLRHLSEESAFETLEQAMPLIDKVVGVGQRQAVALRQREDQLGLQRALDVDVQLGLGHGAQQLGDARGGNGGNLEHQQTPKVMPLARR